MELIPAGKIVNTHGIKRDVKAEVWLDSAAFLRKFPRIFIGGEEMKLLRCSELKGMALMSLEGTEDVNAAMLLKGKEFSVNKDDVRLSKGAYFLSDILGFDVYDTGGEKIGVLEDAFESPAHMIYTVRGETEHLIPAIPEFIKEIDPEGRKITVELIEGM